MLVLLTGATGFVGGHCAEALIEAGHKVRATARNPEKVRPLTEKGADVRLGSLSDTGFLREVCEGVDVAVNMAGKLGGWGVREEELKLANITITKKLVSAAEQQGVRQFIHCSTPGVVGMSGVAPEDCPYCPMGLYEKTKVEAEEFVLSRRGRSDMAVTVIRPDFVYGPGDKHKLRLFQAVKRRRFPLIGGGKSLLHPTYVTDVTQGLLLMLGNNKAYGEVFNIAGAAPVSVHDLVDAVSHSLGIGKKPINVPSSIAISGALACEAMAKLLHKPPPITLQQVRFFTTDHASDITKARCVLGYMPAVDVRQGIGRTVAWYEDNGLI